MNSHRKVFRGILIATATAVALVTSGCDEGKIYPPEQTGSSQGVTVRMTGNVTGISDFYGSGYSIALAVFADGSDFAEVSKNIGEASSDLELTNVTPGGCRAEVCSLNTLRKRVFTLVQSDEITANGADLLRFDVGDIDVSPFNVIGEKVFATTCLQCHGGTGHSAAGLDLNREKAYSMLVNVPSTVVEGMKRVAPGHPYESTLWEAVATEISSGWSFNHSNLLEPEKSGFIRYWIEKGAKR